MRNPATNTDILSWDYRLYESNHDDVTWASPPCTGSTRALTTIKCNINAVYCSHVVLETLEVIDYLNPDYYILETPKTDLIKEKTFIGFMYGIPYKDMDYFYYIMFHIKIIICCSIVGRMCFNGPLTGP